MRLVIITPYFAPKIGGLENYAYAIAQGLVKAGDTVSIITSNHLGNSFIKDTVDGLAVYRLPTLFKVSNTPIHPLWYFQIKKLLKELAPDIINAHLPVPFIGDMSVLAADSLNIPSVVTYHNDIVKEGLILKTISWLYYQLLGKFTLAKSSKIIATSAHYVDNSTYLSQHKNKIVIVPPGVHERKSVESKGEKKYVIFVGQLDVTHRHKGLPYLIEAFSELKEIHPELKLLVVGKGNDVESYKQLAEELRVKKNVKFAGYVSDDELADLYERALCLCLPSTSDSEGFGMVVLEAALHKTPSIGTKVGGISQAIQDNQTGLLIPPKNVVALKEAISKLYTNRNLRNSLGQNAHSRVKADFTWDKQVHKTISLFEELLP